MLADTYILKIHVNTHTYTCELLYAFILASVLLLLARVYCLSRGHLYISCLRRGMALRPLVDCNFFKWYQM